MNTRLFTTQHFTQYYSTRLVMQQINTSVSGIFAQQSQPGTMLATGKVMKPEPFNEVRLVEYIMEGYNTAARPVRNITTTTTLEISLYVIQILKLVRYTGAQKIKKNGS